MQRPIVPTFSALVLVGLALSSSGRAEQATPAPDTVPFYQRDRGPGVPTSLFGTYVQAGELLVYPFYEFTLNRDQEYKPAELGYGLDQDFRAKRTDHEALLFAAYGIQENLAIEIESALWTTANQAKATDDPSGVPSEVTESGFGDTQAELRWRLVREREDRPELFSYFELTFPFQKDRLLIGTQEWEIVPGIGLVKGTRWGTWTTRASLTYLPLDGTVEFGEYALEYMKKLSERWRTVLSVEGEQDEVALIAEAQVFLNPRTCLKLNNGFGLTSKAPDLAPEVGVVFSFR